MEDLVLSTLLFAGIDLFFLWILILYPFRKSLASLFGRGRRRFAVWSTGIVLLLAFSLWQQFYMPLPTYGAIPAQYWMRRAAAAPTDEERERHVRRVVVLSGEYGSYIGARAIRHVEDRKMRCELRALVLRHQVKRMAQVLAEDIRAECPDLKVPDS